MEKKKLKENWNGKTQQMAAVPSTDNKPKTKQNETKKNKCKIFLEPNAFFNQQLFSCYIYLFQTYK